MSEEKHEQDASDEKYEQETVFEPFVPIAPEYQEENESPKITTGLGEAKDKDKLTGQEKKPQPKG